MYYFNCLAKRTMYGLCQTKGNWMCWIVIRENQHINGVLKWFSIYKAERKLEKVLNAFYKH